MYKACVHPKYCRTERKAQQGIASARCDSYWTSRRERRPTSPRVQNRERSILRDIGREKGTKQLLAADRRADRQDGSWWRDCDKWLLISEASGLMSILSWENKFVCFTDNVFPFFNPPSLTSAIFDYMSLLKQAAGACKQSPAEEECTTVNCQLKKCHSVSLRALSVL